jgi:hypothetical protein
MLAILLIVPVVAQTVTQPADFGISDIFPVAVIGVAIAVTSLFKKYVNKSFVDKFIWLPPMLVGIIGAVLLTEPFSIKILIWNAFSWAAGAAFIVLIVKRIGAKPEGE